MASENVTLIPANSDQNIATLREFKNLLQTTMGPTGSSKMCVSGGGYLEVTSASHSLLGSMELRNPVCRYIAHVAAGLPDHGLYCGVVVSQLIDLQWTSAVRKHKLIQFVSSLIQALKKLLTSEFVSISVDFNSINSFLPLVKTIISSKSSILFPGLDVDKFCIEIVKVFLNCIDDQTNLVERVHMKVERGPNIFSSYKGLLYRLTEDDDIKVIEQLEGEVKIVVFTIKLSEEEEDCKEKSLPTISKIFEILKQAIKSGAQVVACQKTVAAQVKLFLMRQKIVLLERMGTDLTTQLLRLSQAFPISRLFTDVSDVADLLGTLSAVQHLQVAESDYLLLQNGSASVGTLLIQSSSLVGKDHVQALVEQAVSALRSLVAHPAVTPGGGCLEVWLIAQLQLLKRSQSDKEFSKLCHWIQQALHSTLDSKTPVLMDSVYHHGWREDKLHCNCGLVIRDTQELIPLGEVTSASTLSPPRLPGMSLNAHVLVESHHQKYNAIILALETFSNISDIGFFVYKH